MKVSRTFYKNTPINIGWRCSKCDCVNMSAGSFQFMRNSTATSWRAERDQKRASEDLNNTWKDDAIKLLKHPEIKTSAFREALFVSEDNCKRCGKKPVWAYREPEWFQGLVALSLICIIGLPIYLLLDSYDSTIVDWCILFVLAIPALLHFINLFVYSYSFRHLGKKYKPVIVSIDPELMAYAEGTNQIIPSAYEMPKEETDSLEPYNGNGIHKERIMSKISADRRQTSVTTSSTEEPVFCHKCGKKLKPESDFCSYCGAALK